MPNVAERPATPGPTSVRRQNTHSIPVLRSSEASDADRSRGEPGFWNQYLPAGIILAGVLALAAAWFATTQPAVICLFSGGLGAVTAGAARLFYERVRPPKSPLDNVLALTDEHLEQTQSDAQWEELLGRDDSRLLHCIEQRLAPGDRDEGNVPWRRILESLSDGVCLTRGTDSIAAATPAFLALLNCPPDTEATDRSLIEMLRTVSDTGADAITQRLQQGNQSFTIELSRGSSLDDGVLRLNRTPLRDDKDGMSGVWILRDVTHQKLSEEARNRFVATATHELRTPLTNLKAYAETLALTDDLSVEEQKTFCNTINAEATRLARFVDELLNLSRMDGGDMSIVRSETDIGRLICDTVDHVRPQFASKSQQFDVSLPPKFPRMSVDKDSVAAAVVNLLGNACKYTPEGGVVRFEVELQEDSILLHVEDSGIGIAPEEVRQIFDRFFRSSDTRVRDIEGTGLGLAYVKEVARLHGGQVSVHSEVNNGSRFTLALPVA